MKYVICCICLLSFIPNSLQGWGFYAHKKINEYAVFCLSPKRMAFYKPYLQDIIQYAVIPDIRKNVSVSEYAKHYIDLELYDMEAFNIENENFYHECILSDSCRSNGVLPWYILELYSDLKTAIYFDQKSEIVKKSGELAHYISDACVPLHTTVNYDGQLTGQDGIHSLWETDLPELYFQEYNLYGIYADTFKNVPKIVENLIMDSHNLKDSVLYLHQLVLNDLSVDSYGVTSRNGKLKSDYNYNFKQLYHKKLNQMIKKQLKKSILLSASLWETAWMEVELEKSHQ